MPTDDAPIDDAPEDDEAPPSTGRFRRRLSEWRRLARIAYRDPEHVPARLTLYGAQRLGESSLTWAGRVADQRPDAPRGVVAEEVRIQTAKVARIDGAIAGTPFLIALVPGYLAYIWQEEIMQRRIAALYGHDPRDLENCAELLALRGVHPSVDVARDALLRVRDAPLPDKPTQRRPLRVWYRSVYALLIFGGFLSAPEDGGARLKHWRLKAAFGFLAGAAIWVITWVLPLSFMIAMAWGCENHARTLGSRAMSFYGGESASTEAAIAAAERHDSAGHTKREVIRGALLALSVIVPIGFVAYANHVRQTTGINWVGAIGALVAASLVIATSVNASRG